MNDFLQSLRGGQKEKRAPKTRRSFDNANFNAAPNYQNHGNYQGTRAGNIKRPSTRGPAHTHMQGGDQQPTYAPPLDPLDVMLDLLDVYTKNQEMIITVQEKRVIAEERKAIALEEIAEYMRVITMPSFHEAFPLKGGASSAPKVPISEDLDGESDVISSEARRVVKIEQTESDVDYEEVDDTEYADSQTIDVEYADPQNIDPEPHAFKVIETQSPDNQGIDTGDDEARTVEAGTKSSLEDSLDEDDKRYIKVIRRKKTENTRALSPKKTEKMVSDSEMVKPWTRGREEAKIKVAEPEEREAVTLEESTLEPSAKVAPLLPREEVMEIIQSMRAQGKTFDEVAQHLVALGQPTFSGRGDWHAQTIHRLCTRKSKKEQKSK